MISQRARGLQNALLLCQSLLTVLLLCLCALVVFGLFVGATALHLEHYPFYGGVLVTGLVIESMSRDRARARINLFQAGFIGHHRLALRQICYSVGTLLLYLAVMKDAFISRTFLFAYVPVFYLGLFWSNYYGPRLLARRLFRGIREERTLLIGSVENASRIDAWIKHKENFGFRTIGLLSDNPNASNSSRFRLLGATDQVRSIVQEHLVSQVILLELPDSSTVHQELVVFLEKQGIRLLILSNLEQKLRHPVVHVEDEGFSFITLRQEPLENPFNRFLKRVIDLLIAWPVVALILPPVCVVVWLLQRWQSPGPLFYRQTRAGIQNRRFEIIKLRTMRMENDDITRQATREDARIYPAGRWLRRFSLDELPQFLNVLRGDMSVVGPRPHLIEHNAQFAREMANYHIRAFVKPGITGLAQVRGFRGEARTGADISRRLASDISYLENWRAVLDVTIVLRTIAQMFFPPRSAY